MVNIIKKHWAYFKGYNICLAFKVICHKPYKNLLLFLISTHLLKNLLIDFITILTISAYWKNDNYNSIQVIINWLIKMIYYERVKLMINTPDLVKVIIDLVIYYHRVLKSIFINWGLLFISKFWFSLCYSQKIKKKLFIAIYLQINGIIKRQNNIIERNLWVFLHWDQNSLRKLLPIAKFALNYIKNDSICCSILV